jgi:putative ABC transport system permease protein
MCALNQQKGIEASLAAIQAVFKKDNPAYPFDYRFVDDQFSQMFASEMLVSKLSRVFCCAGHCYIMPWFIWPCCLYCRTTYKEIGIRKVLGASVSGLATLLSQDFLKLVTYILRNSFPTALYAHAKLA